MTSRPEAGGSVSRAFDFSQGKVEQEMSGSRNSNSASLAARGDADETFASREGAEPAELGVAGTDERRMT
jgi:hypothetical protein